MFLHEVEPGQKVFIDANIFVYHFSQGSRFNRSCTDFLNRVEASEVRGMQIIDYILDLQIQTVDLVVSNSRTFIFTDATYLQICRNLGIRHIATADGNFEKNLFSFEIWKP